jgi:hypothetical protein
MKIRLGRTAVLALSTTVALLGSACKQSPKPEVAQQATPKPAPSVPNIKVTPPVQAKAKTPKAGPHATKKPATDAIGKGKAAIHFKGRSHDRSFWAEQLDVDNSGNPVLVDEGWDNHAKVFYVSNDRTFTCGNGQIATGSTLMAVYGKGNPRKRPEGSGWWVSELNAGDCGVPRAGLYGCRFDAAGKNHDCGEANIQSDTNDVLIVPMPQSGASQGGSSVSGQASPGNSSSSAPSGTGSNASPGTGSNAQ